MTKFRSWGWGNVCLWAPAEVYPNTWGHRSGLKQGESTVEIMQAVSGQWKIRTKKRLEFGH